MALPPRGAGLSAPPKRRVRAWAWAGVLLAALANTALADPVCTPHDLGGFTLCVPPGWQLEGTGADSAAGVWHAPGPGAALQLSHDYGLYSDPLKQLPAGATGRHERALQVDGHPARELRYTEPGRDGGPPVQVLALHVPLVQRSAMGPIRLTLMARSTDPARLREAEAVFASLRFKPPR